MEELDVLRAENEGQAWLNVLPTLEHRYPNQVVFTTSFGLEDQAITHAIRSVAPGIRIVTLDTGRLFPETYEVWTKTVLRYGNVVEAFFPPTKELQEFLTTKGPNSFYNSVESRKECCRIRKLLPLDEALRGAKIWITGLRREQSDFRTELEHFEWDSERKLIKYQPLLDWTWEDTQIYTKENSIPYNTLHDQGYPSIGCAPCTRAILPGENFRAGRWWWEEDSKKECGLHWVDGKLVPNKGSAE